jgi:hypothetical protein
MAFTHKTDTVYAIKGQKGKFDLRVSRGFPPRQIARKKLFPIAEARFKSYSSPYPVVVDQATGDYFVTIEMEPGEVSVFGEWSESEYINYVGANNDNYPPGNRLTVACLKEPSEPPIDFVDLKAVPGGTYVHFQGDPPSVPGSTYFARMWVDLDETNLSVLSKRVDRTLQDASTTQHLFYREFPRPPVNVDWSPLTPGATYSYFVQLLDNHGNHNAVLYKSVTTKQRTVDIRLLQLRVTQDGDDGDTAEAEFVASIFKDSNVVPSSIWRWGDDNSPQTINDAAHPADGPQTFITIDKHESFPAQPGDYQIGVNAHGREFDDFSDELAAVKQWIPVASLGEWHGLSQDDFAFEIEVSYSVKYV